MRSLFFSIVQLNERFMIINKLVYFSKVNPIFLIFCHHSKYQIKQILHWDWKSWFYIRWYRQLTFSQQYDIFFMIRIFLKYVRVTSCNHFKKYDSQWKNITFWISCVICLCEFLEWHILTCPKSYSVKFYVFIKNRKPKISQLISLILD